MKPKTLILGCCAAAVIVLLTPRVISQEAAAPLSGALDRGSLATLEGDWQVETRVAHGGLPGWLEEGATRARSTSAGVGDDQAVRWAFGADPLRPGTAPPRAGAGPTLSLRCAESPGSFTAELACGGGTALLAERGRGTPDGALLFEGEGAVGPGGPHRRLGLVLRAAGDGAVQVLSIELFDLGEPRGGAGGASLLVHTILRRAE